MTYSGCKAGFELISTKKVEYTVTDNMVAVTMEGKARRHKRLTFKALLINEVLDERHKL